MTSRKNFKFRRRKSFTLCTYDFFLVKKYQFDSGDGNAKCHSNKLWHFDSNSYLKSLNRNDKAVLFLSFPVKSIFTRKMLNKIWIWLQFRVQSIKYLKIATYNLTHYDISLCKILSSNILPEKIISSVYLLMFWIVVVEMKCCVNTLESIEFREKKRKTIYKRAHLSRG